MSKEDVVTDPPEKESNATSDSATIEHLNHDDIADEEIESVVSQCSEEYQDLNTTLDELDSCLTVLEKKNTDLFSKVEELLETNRQTRREIQEAQQQEETNVQQKNDEK